MVAAIILLNLILIPALYFSGPIFCDPANEGFWTCLYRNFISLSNWRMSTWQHVVFVILAPLDYLLLIFLLFFNAYTIAKNIRSYSNKKTK